MNKSTDNQTHFPFNKCFFETQAVDSVHQYVYFEAEDGQCARIPLEAIKHIAYVRKRGTTARFTAAGTQYDWSFSVTFYNSQDAVLAEVSVKTEDKKGLDDLQGRIFEAQRTSAVIEV